MKKVLFATVLFLSVQSMASVCSQSWESIAGQGQSAQFPKVLFGTTFVSVDGVCVSGDQLRTQQPVEVCSVQSSHEGSSCSESISMILTTPITYQHDIPVGEGSFETITESHALNYSIPVGHDGEGFHAVCHKAYSIPACQ
jgi:hypothetical protein